ncbi:unnamed protein product [Rotaria sp. Silwood1]|nr:unnamed protein product [Rotaria sp. Silwood1]CAF3353544.1 unnamed protein product [Rotaria sp. Silwood1]CAF4749457.1 unnamed protein product [Rotaria sp. Silwood1]
MEPVSVKDPSEFTVECSSIEVPTLSSSISIDHQILISSISFVQSKQDVLSINSTETSTITNDIRKATFTFDTFEPIINTWDDVFADSQQDDITTAADIESIEKYSANSTKEALTDEAVFQVSSVAESNE